MKKFVSALVLLLMLCSIASAAQVSMDNIFAIYDNGNGYVQIFPDGDDMKAAFSINQVKAQGSGYFDDNKAFVTLDNDEEVTLTFGGFDGRHFEMVNISGYKPFNGTYNAYHGHM